MRKTLQKKDDDNNNNSDGKKSTSFRRASITALKNVLSPKNAGHNQKRRAAIKHGDFLYGNDMKNQQKTIFFEKMKKHQFVDHRAVTPQTHYMHECETYNIIPIPTFLSRGEKAEINLKHLSLGNETTIAVSESVNMTNKATKISTRKLIII